MTNRARPLHHVGQGPSPAGAGDAASTRLGAHLYDDKGQAALDGRWHIGGIVYGQ